MNHGDAFAGIGGFGLAAKRAGWKTIWAAEIDDAARAVYSARLGHPGLRFDRDIRESVDLPAIDILTGGFPCQDISVAGKGAGLAGSRSSLFFELVRILEISRPQWFVFENVDALLSVNSGRDMGVVLSTLVDCGYCVAWRVLNSRHFGLAQRRSRVFLVGHSSDWRCAAAVLFESARGCRNPQTRNKARRHHQGTDPVDAVTSSGGRRSRVEDARSSLVVGTLQAGGQQGYRIGAEDVRDGHVVSALLSRGAKGVGTTIDGQLVMHTLTSEGRDASEDGTGRGAGIVTHPTLTQGFGQLGSGGSKGGRPPVLIPALVTRPYGDAVSAIPPLVAATLCGGNSHRGGSNAKTQAESLIVCQNQRGEVCLSERAGALSHGGGIPGQGYQLAATVADRVGEASRIPRSLDVREVAEGSEVADEGSPDLGATVPCEVCAQGPDSPRYRGLGNAVSVPVIEWIFGRINACS